MSQGGPAWGGLLATVMVFVVPFFIPQITRTARKIIKPTRCSECLGVGNNLCVLCKGRGKTGGVFTGIPLEKCGLCKGRGRQLCKRCQSTGLANNWLYTPLENGGWGPRGLR
ncbi:unnamed protein product [Calypogeia fissa]